MVTETPGRPPPSPFNRGPFATLASDPLPDAQGWAVLACVHRVAVGRGCVYDLEVRVYPHSPSLCAVTDPKPVGIRGCLRSTGDPQETEAGRYFGRRPPGVRRPSE